jgi:hypothetical protein
MSKPTSRRSTKEEPLGKFDRLAKALEPLLASGDRTLPQNPRLTPRAFVFVGYFLAWAATAKDPLVFTYFLQICLAELDITTPEGVFRTDYSVAGSGRPHSDDIGDRARKLHDEERNSWSVIARKLIPDEWAKNKKRASDKIRRRAENSGGTMRLAQLYASPKPVHRAILKRFLGLEQLRQKFGLPADKEYKSIGEMIGAAMLRDTSQGAATVSDLAAMPLVTRRKQ